MRTPCISRTPHAAVALRPTHKVDEFGLQLRKLLPSNLTEVLLGILGRLTDRRADHRAGWLRGCIDCKAARC
jgi:hypothetical protein